PERSDQGIVRFATATKAVTFGPAKGNERTVVLLVRGSREYGGHLRSPDQPWPHLLVEQPLTQQPSLTELASLRFRITYQLLRAQTNGPGPLRAWHCAQFQAVIIVKNLNQASAGYGDYLWFGIPLYDSRYRVPPEYAGTDAVGSGKFVYSAPGKAFGEPPAGKGDWVNIDCDLVQLIRQGVERAWKNNFMT